MYEIDLMPLDEFNQWAEYHRTYPIDGSREDYRSAIQSSVTSAVWGGTTNPDDFIPRFGVSTKNINALAYFTMLAAHSKKQNTK